MKFVTELRRRRRDSLGLLVISFLPLAFLTYKLLAHAVAPAAGSRALNLVDEWAVVPFFALPWIAWLVLLRQFVRGPRPRGDQAPISATIAALLQDNRKQRTFYKIVGAVLLASALMLPLIVHQLRGVGKMGNEVTIPAFVLYPLYVAGVLIWAVRYDRRTLRPRGHELEALLQAYERDGR